MSLTASLKAKFVDCALSLYPRLDRKQFDSLVSDNLLSPFQVELPRSILKQAESAVSVFFDLRKVPRYVSRHSMELMQRKIEDPGNFSILMSYDFHIDAQRQLKLIEVNTNASFCALGEIMYQTHGLPLPVSTFKMEDLRNSIKAEMQLNGQKSTMPRVAIIDEKPEQERLFAEFLVYQELFKSWGWTCDIKDFREDLTNYDFIYNRLTDFYFEKPESKILLQKFNGRTQCFSPNPHEYLLLADKNRMVEWSQPDEMQSLSLSIDKMDALAKFLPKTRILTASNAEAMWENRKHLFFKPMRSFGAKQSYRGGSMSRKTFDEMIQGANNGQFLAQEFVPAPEMTFPVPSGPDSFKFDLRFYAYQDRIQSVVARLYQGQVTNLKTPMGGFAPVVWT